MTERQQPEGPEHAAPPEEPGEGGVDQEMIDRGEDGPRDGDIGQYEEDEE